MYEFSHEILIAWEEDPEKFVLWEEPKISIPIFPPSYGSFCSFKFPSYGIYYIIWTVHRFSHEFPVVWVNLAKSIYHMGKIWNWNIDSHTFPKIWIIFLPSNSNPMGYWKSISTLNLEYLSPPSYNPERRGLKASCTNNVSLYKIRKTLENFFSIIFPLKGDKKFHFFPNYWCFLIIHRWMGRQNLGTSHIYPRTCKSTCYSVSFYGFIYPIHSPRYGCVS